MTDFMIKKEGEKEGLIDMQRRVTLSQQQVMARRCWKKTSTVVKTGVQFLSSGFSDADADHARKFEGGYGQLVGMHAFAEVFLSHRLPMH